MTKKTKVYENENTTVEIWEATPTLANFCQNCGSSIVDEIEQAYTLGLREGEDNKEQETQLYRDTANKLNERYLEAKQAIIKRRRMQKTLVKLSLVALTYLSAVSIITGLIVNAGYTLLEGLSIGVIFGMFATIYVVMFALLCVPSRRRRREP